MPLRPLSAGVPQRFRYSSQTSLRASSDYFVAGSSAATYWGVLGWMDTPLVIVNVADRVRHSRDIIAVGAWSPSSIIAFALSLGPFRVDHNSRSTVDWLPQPSSSVRTPSSIATYVLSALWFALYVVTDNVFGAEGRHWYPYIFGSFICFVWYAPANVSSAGTIQLRVTRCAAGVGYVRIASVVATATSWNATTEPVQTRIFSAVRHSQIRHRALLGSYSRYGRQTITSITVRIRTILPGVASSAAASARFGATTPSAPRGRRRRSAQSRCRRFAAYIIFVAEATLRGLLRGFRRDRHPRDRPGRHSVTAYAEVSTPEHSRSCRRKSST